MDLISVVVPVYNAEKFLERCLKSIINQTYKNLEIILIDDGSTDSSGKICDDFAKCDSRIKVVHQKNAGSSIARNVALDMCTGKYITFVDSDDWVSEDYCECLYNKIIETDADVSIVKTLLVVENANGIKNVTPKKEKVKGEFVVFEKNDIVKQILTEKLLDNYILGKLYKRQFVNEIRFKENVVFEDIVYVYDVFSKAERVVYVNKECYFHLKHKEAISAICSEKNIYDYISATMHRYSLVQADFPDLEIYNIYALLREITNICIKYVIADSYYEEVEEKLIEVFKIFKKFNIDKEYELLKMMNDFQKTSAYIIRYNPKLFFDLLASRHNLRWKRKFDSKSKDKPKIVLVCDVPNWAFDRIAQQVKKELGHKYDMRIDYFNRRTEADFFYELLERNSDCDLMHFLNRRMLLLMDSEAFKQKIEDSGRNVDEYIAEKKNKISTAIYDYIDLDEAGISEHKYIFNDYSKAYYAATKKLFEIYTSIEEFKNPDAMVHDICDKDQFPTINLERFELESIKDRPIVVGWVGNSVHNDEKEVDLKGFNTILKPVMDELKAESYNVVGNYADRKERWRSAEEMPEYYSGIDVCICASIHEGTPRPVLEAMYSGVPIISTDVGIVGEALGEKQRQFIIGDRENGQNDENIRKALKEKIIYLYNNRHLFKELSEENMRSIEEFDGGKTIKDFEKFFDMCLKK